MVSVAIVKHKKKQVHAKDAAKSTQTKPKRPFPNLIKTHEKPKTIAKPKKQPKNKPAEKEEDRRKIATVKKQEKNKQQLLQVTRSHQKLSICFSNR